MRQWLGLPHDVAIAYIHAPVKEGGLGVPSLAYTVPALRARRLRALESSSWPVARAVAGMDFVQNRLQWCDRVLAMPSQPRGDLDSAAKLHQSVDGRELRQCKQSSASSAWVAGGCEGIPARDYHHYHAIRVGAVLTRAWMSRVARAGLPLRPWLMWFWFATRRMVDGS